MTLKKSTHIPNLVAKSKGTCIYIYVFCTLVYARVESIWVIFWKTGTASTKKIAIPAKNPDAKRKVC